jgi:hypothetical protein
MPRDYGISRFLFSFQRTSPGGEEAFASSVLTSSRLVRTDQSEDSLELTGIEPVTPGLQSRCSPS